MSTWDFIRICAVRTYIRATYCTALYCCYVPYGALQCTAVLLHLTLCTSTCTRTYTRYQSYFGQAQEFHVWEHTDIFVVMYFVYGSIPIYAKLIQLIHDSLHVRQKIVQTLVDPTPGHSIPMPLASVLLTFWKTRSKPKVSRDSHFRNL